MSQYLLPVIFMPLTILGPLFICYKIFSHNISISWRYLLVLNNSSDLKLICVVDRAGHATILSQTMWPCFQGTKLFVIAILLYLLWLPNLDSESFSGPWLVLEALLRCPVVVVAKLKNCRVPSSGRWHRGVRLHGVEYQYAVSNFSKGL